MTLIQEQAIDIIKRLPDALMGRKPYCDNADRIIKLCADGKIHGYLAAHSISNIFYILRKEYSVEDRRKILLNLCNILTVIGVGAEKVISALKNSDFICTDADAKHAVYMDA